jgi:hypothetical protein
MTICTGSWQAVLSEIVALVEPIGGALMIGDETADSGYFAWDERTRRDVMEAHVEPLADVCSRQPRPFVR